MVRLAALGTLVVLTLVLVPVALGAPPREASLETLLVALDLERKGKVQDVEDLDRITARVSSAETAVLSARNRLLQVLKDGEADAQAIEAAEESIAEAHARASAIEERRKAVAARLSERVRRISALGEEISKRRAGLRGPSDPLTGRWAVVINPGGRRGTYRLILDGALVAGDFVMDGGFKGSLRGTLVGERLSLQRIDSERGLDATFVGRLNASQRRIAGTWDATQLAPVTGPTAGEWLANQIPEREDE